MNSNYLCRSAAVPAAVLLVAFTLMAGGREKILHVFDAAPAENPMTMLIEDQQHNLYGTTFYDSSYSAGSVYELSPGSGGEWEYRVLHVFKKAEGCYPDGKLLMDAAGTLYGTTYDGGAHNCGTVYRLKRASDGSWMENTLHDFNQRDGCLSQGGLAMDKQGNLYGGTLKGGSHQSGVAFKVAHTSNDQWRYHLLHEFDQSEANPDTGFIFDAAGNLYGGDQTGIFVLSQKNGRWAERTAYAFQKETDGYAPSGDLFFDSQGNLYGTNGLGGQDNRGTVFELSPDSRGGWTSTVLHSFSRGHDGHYPLGGVIVGPDGDVYGTTSTGGQHGAGTVFRLAPGADGWTETLLHSFAGRRDGGGPMAGVLLGHSGKLYGTAYSGGAHGVGVVFELAP
jgi:uncharacterized repeat protein (TIGR03803 family)